MDSFVRTRLQKWGNSYGMRITKADAKRLGWKEGDELDVPVVARRARKDLSHLPSWDLGGALSTDHDDAPFEAL